MHYVSPVLSYYGLRSYGGGEQEIGAEKTPQQYVAHLVEVFRAVHRVLRDDGTLWCVLGDSYASGSRTTQVAPGQPGARPPRMTGQPARAPALSCVAGKNLMMIPHRVALALQADGWYVRQEIVWSKPAPMPESVTDRCTRSHELIFMLAKKPTYYYDPDAIREPQSPTSHGGRRGLLAGRKLAALPIPPSPRNTLGGRAAAYDAAGRNKRSVWTIGPQPLAAEHYAAFPEKLVEPMVLAGTSEAGCCPRCGAPWRRVVERSAQDERVVQRTRNVGGRTDGFTRTKASGGLPPVHMTTTGWEPGCPCAAGPPLPCTTLDPFLGSGTTALVSKRLGRSCVGIELNESYCEMARRRVESVPYTLFSGAASTEGAAR